MTFELLARGAASFGVALVLGLILTPVVRAMATRFGFVTRPAADRWAKKPTALLGGVGITLAAVLGASVGLAATGGAIDLPAHLATARPAVGVLLAAAMMFFVGLADDILNLKPNVKFAFQALAGVLLVSMGATIPITSWYWVNVLVTVFWFVAITNAVNLLDNMDGVAAGIVAIAALFLGLASFREGAWLSGAFAWAITGACLGFLRYNFAPASIFMGDAGSMFLGASLAGLAAAAPARTSGSLVSVLFVPLSILALPVLDTALVTITRAVAGRAFYQGGRDHTAHRLVAFGLNERQVSLLLYAFAASGGLVALWLTKLDLASGLAVGAAFLASLSLLAAYLGHLHVEYANEPRGSRAVTVIVTQLLYKRRLAEMLLDAALLGIAWIAAFRLRFDELPPAEYMLAFEHTLPIALAVQLVSFNLCGVYKGAWRYVSVEDIYRICGALLLSTIALVLYAEWQVPQLGQSHGIIYINTLAAAALTMTARMSWKSLHVLRRTIGFEGAPAIVYGAGDAGDMAIREMKNNPSLGLIPVCLLDDDRRKHGARIHGVKVIGGVESAALALEQFQAKIVVIAATKLKDDVRAALRALADRDNVSLIELDLRFRPLELVPGESTSLAALFRTTPPRKVAGSIAPQG